MSRRSLLCSLAAISVSSASLRGLALLPGANPQPNGSHAASPFSRTRRANERVAHRPKQEFDTLRAALGEIREVVDLAESGAEGIELLFGSMGHAFVCAPSRMRGEAASDPLGCGFAPGRRANPLRDAKDAPMAASEQSRLRRDMAGFVKRLRWIAVGIFHAAQVR